MFDTSAIVAAGNQGLNLSKGASALPEHLYDLKVFRLANH